MITLQEIKQNESIKALVRAGNRYLETLGYTDHGPRHLGYVSRTASEPPRAATPWPLPRACSPLHRTRTTPWYRRSVRS